MSYLEAIADYMDFGPESLEVLNTESVIFNSGFLDKEYSETIIFGRKSKFPVFQTYVMKHHC